VRPDDGSEVGQDGRQVNMIQSTAKEKGFTLREWGC
jgi:hypothetical protein